MLRELPSRPAPLYRSSPPPHSRFTSHSRRGDSLDCTARVGAARLRCCNLGYASHLSLAPTTGYLLVCHRYVWTETYGESALKAQCARHFRGRGDEVWAAFNRVFDCLPIAAVRTPLACRLMRRCGVLTLGEGDHT